MNFLAKNSITERVIYTGQSEPEAEWEREAGNEPESRRHDAPERHAGMGSWMTRNPGHSQLQ
jgi:hypothetical protein